MQKRYKITTVYISMCSILGMYELRAYACEYSTQNIRNLESSSHSNGKKQM